MGLKEIIPQAIAKDFTDLIVINDDKKDPSILLQFMYTLGVSWSHGYGL